MTSYPFRGAHTESRLFSPKLKWSRGHFHPYLITTIFLLATLQGLARPVLVAVIDTGIDFDHTQIKSHLWRNPGELGPDSLGGRKEDNQLDDDGNGWIDDVIGADLTGEGTRPVDHHGHGTHIAGIISSINPEAKIMSLKYFSQKNPNDNLMYSRLALEYAIQKGADIINYSGGGYGFDAKELALLKLADQRNILVVAAAGNDGLDIDRSPFFPGAYGLKNLLTVASLGPGGGLLASSNFGKDSVFVAAPGFEITSTLPKGKWGPMTGTSQATAFVSGWCSRLLSWGEKPQNIKKKILRMSRILASLKGKTKYSSALLYP